MRTIVSAPNTVAAPDEPGEFTRIAVLLAMVSIYFCIVLGAVAGNERERREEVQAMRAEHRRAMANQASFVAAVRKRWHELHESTPAP